MISAAQTTFIERRVRGRLAALERPAPAGEHTVNLLRADDRLVRERQLDGVEDERLRLRPAEPAVEGDQLLEGAALLESRVVEAADHDVGDVREAVRAQQVPRRVRRERRPADRRPRPFPRRGSAPRPHPARRARARDERTRIQPTCGCSRRAGISRGWRCVDLLERRAGVAPPSARSGRGCPEPSTTTCRSETSFFDCLSFGSRPVASPSAWPTIASCSSPPATPATVSSSSERSTRSSQPVAVSLLEGRALRLAVVGEHDELVRARRVAARAVDAAELLVELAQRLERVRALEPRVVCDLVVAREGRVDGRPPPHHVREDAVDDQVADDHAHRPAHERVDAAAVAPRAHVATFRAERRDPFEDHLPAEQDERARDVEPVGEEGAVAGVRPLLRLDPADGEDDLVGLAGEQVARGSCRRRRAGRCRSPARARSARSRPARSTP